MAPTKKIASVVISLPAGNVKTYIEGEDDVTDIREGKDALAVVITQGKSEITYSLMPYVFTIMAVD